MKCDRFGSLFPRNKKNRKRNPGSPNSDREYVYDKPDPGNYASLESGTMAVGDYDFSNSYFDGCFMPPWNQVVKYRPEMEFDSLSDLVKPEELWEDPSGVMELNSRQRKRFSSWIRYFNLHDRLNFFASPPTPDRIKQGYVGDCSTLSSLSSLAEYEKNNESVLTDKIKLIDLEETVRSLMNLGCPEECLNYLRGYKLAIGVKIFFNGTPRCMFVDDWVPIRKDQTLLCAHSSDPHELWVTLFEKANVRLYGKTYSIKGTNPGIDTYHITGWIPEIIPLPPYHFKLPNSEFTQPLNGSPAQADEDVEDLKNAGKLDLIWTSMVRNYNTNLVVCLGTNELYDVTTTKNYIEGISASSGIVSGHAYSVLDLKEVDLHGVKNRLLLLKNPWGKIGSKLELDSDLAGLLPDPRFEGEEDTGVFWIRWADVLKWFSHLYLCWNNERFKYVDKLGFTWERSDHFNGSPVPEDSYLSLYNPQVLLSSPDSDTRLRHGGRASMAESEASGSDEHVVYAMLVQNKTTPAEKMRYLAMHIFEGDSRVITPTSPSVNGVYNNSEVILSKLLIAPEGSVGNASLYGNCNRILSRTDTLSLVLLLSYYMKKVQAERGFTLITFSNKPLKLQLLPPLIDGFKNVIFDYAWSQFNNGGSPNEIWSFFSNPHFRLEVDKDMDALILLETDSGVSVNLRLFYGRVATVRALRTKQVLSSNEYKHYCCAIRGPLSRGIYTLIPSNFNGREAKFRINIFHDNSRGQSVHIYPIPYPYMKLDGLYAESAIGSTTGPEFPGKEYKIDMPVENMVIDCSFVGGELINASLFRCRVLDFHVLLAKMTGQHFQFRVSADTLLSIRIKVNSLSDNKFVLFSQNCQNYRGNESGTSKCLMSRGGRTRGLCFGPGIAQTDFDPDSMGDSGACGHDGAAFCSEATCPECGGPSGQFCPTNPSLFAEELRLGFTFCVFSDLNGGISKNGRKPSNSAHVLFLKEGVVNFSLVSLYPGVRYRLTSVNQFKFQELVFISNSPIQPLS